jgi:hypothetical protein
MAKKRSNAPKIDDLQKTVPIHVQREQRVLRHKEWANLWNGKRYGSYVVHAFERFVELRDHAGARSLAYDVSETEWERRLMGGI